MKAILKGDSGGRGLKAICPLLVSLVVVPVRFACGLEMPASIERPEAETGPTQVAVGIWIVDINSINSAEQSFTAEIAVILRWKDPRLAHTGKGVTHYALEQIWHPRVSVVNETNSVIHKLPESVEIQSDGTVLYRQHYTGAFTQ